MSSMAPIPPDSQSQHMDDLKADLRATLEARREVGAEYDEQFIQSLAEKITAQARQEVANSFRRRGRLGSTERTAIAICSLIFGVPAVVGAAATPLVFGGIILLVALINLLAAL